MTVNDEQDSSLASFLKNIHTDTLTYLRTKIAKKDGSVEEIIDKILDDNSNVPDSTDANVPALPSQPQHKTPAGDLGTWTYFWENGSLKLQTFPNPLDAQNILDTEYEDVKIIKIIKVIYTIYRNTNDFDY